MDHCILTHQSQRTAWAAATSPISTKPAEKGLPWQTRRGLCVLAHSLKHDMAASTSPLDGPGDALTPNLGSCKGCPEGSGT